MIRQATTWPLSRLMICSTIRLAGRSADSIGRLN